MRCCIIFLLLVVAVLSDIYVDYEENYDQPEPKVMRSGGSRDHPRQVRPRPTRRPGAGFGLTWLRPKPGPRITRRPGPLPRPLLPWLRPVTLPPFLTEEEFCRDSSEYDCQQFKDFCKENNEYCDPDMW